jgi:signal transduction histidine kinase
MSDETLLAAALRDEARLEALQRTRLLNTQPEEGLDRLTRLVCHLLGVPVALISLVEADRQCFKSAVGLPQPWLLRRETSLLHSFCQHVVATGAPLLVQNAGEHSVFSDSLAIPDLGVVAYLGMPLTTADGHIIGALCAIDNEPRSWMLGDVAALRDLAAVVMSEVTLRRLALELEERVAKEATAHEVTRARARRLDALRQLADGVAHDLADVMQAVQSGVRLASARLRHDAATAQSILALVGDVAQRGSALTTRLLAFVPRGEIRPERVDVTPMLQRLGNVLANSFQTPLRIKVDADPHLPPVLADPEELKAVLLGLAAAARSAMPEGGTLTLRAALDEVAPGAGHPARLRPGCYVRLSVVDTGTGLGGEEQVAAETLSSTTGSPNLSAQLELSLINDFARHVGGGMTRTSSPRVGSTVALWLPVPEDTNTADADLQQK